jgi:hypothetical protein
MKYLRRRCAGFCGNTYPVRKGHTDKTEGNMVEWRTDPFAEEIHGDSTLMWLCDECEHEYAMDI